MISLRYFQSCSLLKDRWSVSVHSEPEELIRSLFKEEPELMIEGKKKVVVFLKRKLFKYPLQVSEVLLKFNPLLSLKIITHFLLTSFFHSFVSIPIENFED